MSTTHSRLHEEEVHQYDENGEQPPVVAGSRRESLLRHDDIQSDDHAGHAALAVEVDQPPHDGVDGDGVPEPSPRASSMVDATPIPGAIDANDSYVASTSSKRRNGEQQPRYPTTLEEDQARDAALEERRLLGEEEQAQIEAQEEQQRREAEAAAAAAAEAEREAQRQRELVIASSTATSSSSLPPVATRRQSQTRRASFNASQVQQGFIPEAQFGANFVQPEEAVELEQRQAAAAHERRASQSALHQAETSSQRRRYQPEEVDATAQPSPLEGEQVNNEQENLLSQGEEQPQSDAVVHEADDGTHSKSRSRSSRRQPQRPQSASVRGEAAPIEEQPAEPSGQHQEEPAEEVPASPSAAAETEHFPRGEEFPASPLPDELPVSPSDIEQPLTQTEQVESEQVIEEKVDELVQEAAVVDEEPLPVFERPERKYFTIEDPQAELARLRATKEFESEFDDIVLPSFQTDRSSPPSNPLQASYNEVHGLIQEEHDRPIAIVNDSDLLNDILGVGRMSLEEVTRMEQEMETERIEELQEEIQRSARRELELVNFQYALLKAHSEREDAKKKDLSEKEHQLLQSTRLLMKEEQESFRRAEDKLREWLARNKQATLNTQMQDLQEKDAKPTQEKLEKEKELKERGDKANEDEADKDQQRQAEIHDLYARVRSRKYEIAWDYEPRLIRIRLDWLRCLKNKLPLGNYNIMVTLYDRLGGEALRWSGPDSNHGTNGQKYQQRTCFSHTGATTHSQRHGGKFYNLELNFYQKPNRIFLACPSMLLSRPSMVFIFELFLMGDAAPVVSTTAAHAATNTRGSIMMQLAGGFAAGAADFAGKGMAYAQELILKARDPKQYKLLKQAQANAAKKALHRAPPSSDRVVAWGAFPMAQINFEIIKGQFKVPLLRGAYGDEPIEKFQTIHDNIANNLDTWLANLYFDVKHWPRILDHQTENSVELHFKGKKLNEDGESSDEEEDDEDGDEQFTITDGVLHEKGIQPVIEEDETTFLTNNIDHDILVLDDGNSGQLEGAARGRSSPSAPHNSQSAAKRGDHHIDLGAVAAAMAADGKSTKKKKKSAPKNHEAVTSTERRMKIKLNSRRHPGMLLDMPDGDDKTMMELRNPKKRAELSSRYRYHVNLSTSSEEEEGHANQAHNPLGRRAAYKMRYIANEVWNDLGFRKEKDWQFWLLLIFASIWVRIYTHYLGQYLFLSSVNIPISTYNCKWYTCDVDYDWDPASISAKTQIGMTVMGVLTNMCLYTLMIGVAVIIQVVLGRTPSWTSRMLLGWGFGTCFEPFEILIIDLAQQNHNGDSFKLYQYYLAKDGNGVSGIFMTILLTLLLVVVSLIIFYWYIIKIHMNGRILDVHYRLQGQADMFHIPHDLEISVRELRWILTKAKRWVGMGGQKRKIAISKFRVRDPLRSPLKTDLSIYIAIYTQSLNGDIELFRHFLRNPSGSIVEIFDSFDIPGEESFKKIEEKLTAHEKRIHSIKQSAVSEFASKLKSLGGGNSSFTNPSLTQKSSFGGLGPAGLTKVNSLPYGATGLGTAGANTPGTPVAGPIQGGALPSALGLNKSRFKAAIGLTLNNVGRPNLTVNRPLDSPINKLTS